MRPVQQPGGESPAGTGPCRQPGTPARNGANGANALGRICLPHAVSAGENRADLAVRQRVRGTTHGLHMQECAEHEAGAVDVCANAGHRADQ